MIRATLAMNPVTVVPMFLVRVEARTPESFLGWCVGDTRLCTVVFRRGVTTIMLIGVILVATILDRSHPITMGTTTLTLAPKTPPLN